MVAEGDSLGARGGPGGVEEEEGVGRGGLPPVAGEGRPAGREPFPRERAGRLRADDHRGLEEGKLLPVPGQPAGGGEVADAIRRDQHPRPRVPELRRELRAAEAHVQGRRHRSEGAHREEDLDVLADVRKLDGDHVARPDPGVVEPSDERFDARFEDGVRDRPPLVDEGHPVRVRAGVAAEPAGKGVRAPPALLDVRTDPLRVEGEGRAQRERLLAEPEVVLERDEPFLAIAPAAAERVQHGVVAGAEPPPLLEVADEGHLGGGESDPLRDLGVPHAELVAVRLDCREVLLADRVAPPGLEVVAEGEDGLAVGGDHLVGHPELLRG